MRGNRISGKKLEDIQCCLGNIRASINRIGRVNNTRVQGIDNIGETERHGIINIYVHSIKIECLDYLDDIFAILNPKEGSHEPLN